MATRLRLTREERCAIIDLNPYCTYCNEDNFDLLVLDHIYPFSLGGSNLPSNFTISCGLCNSHKYNYPVDEFLVTILKKRTEVLNNTLKQIYNLRKFREGEPQHYQHTEKILLKKIKHNKLEHSYFTRIINSIINKKYLIFK